MGQAVNVTGMVLMAAPIGEYDRRVILLTKEKGKISAFARGARRQGSTLLAATNPFAFGEFVLFEGSSYRLQQANISHYFMELSADYYNACYGFYFMDLADYYARENSDEKELLKLLYQSMRALAKSTLDNSLVRCIFELKAMVIAGIYPQMFHCVKCGGALEDAAFFAERGGMLCAACAGGDRKAMGSTEVEQIRGGRSIGYVKDAGRKLGESTIYTMQYIISADIGKLYTFAVTPAVQEELEQAIGAFGRRQIDREFRSLAVLLKCRDSEAKYVPH